MARVFERNPPQSDDLKGARRRSLSVPQLLSPAILLVGAGLYSLAEGPGGATFYITPLTVGVIAIVAGVAGEDRHLVPAGLGIAGWGTAVALVNYNVVPSARTTPAYMVGLAGGILIASYLAPRGDRGSWVHSAVVAAVTAAVFYFLEFSLSSLGRWPAWAVSLVVWAIWLTVQPMLPTGRPLGRNAGVAPARAD